jgi:hypothetical protein
LDAYNCRTLDYGKFVCGPSFVNWANNIWQTLTEGTLEVFLTKDKGGILKVEEMTYSANA